MEDLLDILIAQFNNYLNIFAYLIYNYNNYVPSSRFQIVSPCHLNLRPLMVPNIENIRYLFIANF